MRVLHAYKVFKPEIEGGIPEVIANLVEYAPHHVHSSILVCRSKGGGRKYVYEGAPVVASASLGTLASMPLSPFYVPRLAYEARSVDLVVHHAPFPLTDVAALAFPRKTALVVHWHAEIIGRKLAKAMLAPAIRHSLDRAKRIIVSHPTIAAQSDFLGPYGYKCVAIPYGVDVDYWSTLSVLQQNEVHSLTQRYPKLILAVGRLVDYKGYPYLLEAIKGLDAELIIIGDGPLRPELVRLSADLGIQERVKIVGRLNRDEIKIHLHAAKFLVLASVSAAEAFGIVQAEAMAAGCPIINTSLPTAVPFVAQHELHGLTVPPRNVEALRAAMKRLLEDDELRARLGRAAKARARAEFSHRSFRDSNFRVYDQALGRA